MDSINYAVIAVSHFFKLTICQCAAKLAFLKQDLKVAVDAYIF